MEEITSSFDLKKENIIAFRIVIWAALIYFIVGIVSLLLAMIAVPPVGLSYPYLDTLRQYPRDYFWQYSAIVMLILYIILNSSLGSTIIAERKVISNIGLIFSVMSCVLLIAIYYIQETVVPVSLMNNERDGLALLTQYNPHGLFIALEEVGYMLMLGTLITYFFMFRGKDRTEKAIRIVSAISTIGVVISYIVISLIYGLEKRDRFEIVIILFVWIANILNSFLIYRIFRRKIRELI